MQYLYHENEKTSNFTDSILNIYDIIGLFFSIFWEQFPEYFCQKLILKLIGGLSGLRQFLANESPLKTMKNAFYFTLKAQDSELFSI